MFSHNESSFSTELIPGSCTHEISTTQMTNLGSQLHLSNQQRFQRPISLHYEQQSFSHALKRHRWNCQFGRHNAWPTSDGMFSPPSRWNLIFSRTTPKGEEIWPCSSEDCSKTTMQPSTMQGNNPFVNNNHLNTGDEMRWPARRLCTSRQSWCPKQITCKTWTLATLFSISRHHRGGIPPPPSFSVIAKRHRKLPSPARHKHYHTMST